MSKRSFVNHENLKNSTPNKISIKKSAEIGKTKFMFLFTESLAKEGSLTKGVIESCCKKYFYRRPTGKYDASVDFVGYSNVTWSGFSKCTFAR